jgi:sphingomyelin phosphodiesterase
LATVRRGGYYTHIVPGFSDLRVIGLNNNDCYRMNMWVMYSRVEIAEQLQWFHDTLLAAEAAGQKVHVLAHILSGGGSCFRYWSREYRRVIDRFHRIISGQFYGHSHRDEFNIFYAREQHQTAINYAWLGGATTSYSRTNPNYAVYLVDREIYVRVLAFTLSQYFLIT